MEPVIVGYGSQEFLKISHLKNVRPGEAVTREPRWVDIRGLIEWGLFNRGGSNPQRVNTRSERLPS